MSHLPAGQIRDNIARVRDVIADACAKAGRDPSEVTLVAVSKKKPPADILAAVEAGVQHFGENRVEEAIEKIPAINAQLSAPVIWHMVGHIQSRKARHIPSLFRVVHSVDSLKLGEKLANLSAESGAALDALIQINVAGEAQKHGFDALRWRDDPAQRETIMQDVARIAQLPGLQLRGLMTMAPIVADIEDTRPVFAGLASLRDEMQSMLGIDLPELSMGMTDDYPVAIEEGATIIRVGRAIFGERNAN